MIGVGPRPGGGALWRRRPARPAPATGAVIRAAQVRAYDDRACALLQGIPRFQHSALSSYAPTCALLRSVSSDFAVTEEVGSPGDFGFYEVAKPPDYLHTLRDLGSAHVAMLEEPRALFRLCDSAIAPIGTLSDRGYCK